MTTSLSTMWDSEIWLAKAQEWNVWRCEAGGWWGERGDTRQTPAWEATVLLNFAEQHRQLSSLFKMPYTKYQARFLSAERWIGDQWPLRCPREVDLQISKTFQSKRIFPVQWLLINAYHDHLIKIEESASIDLAERESLSLQHTIYKKLVCCQLDLELRLCERSSWSDDNTVVYIKQLE